MGLFFSAVDRLQIIAIAMGAINLLEDFDSDNRSFNPMHIWTNAYTTIHMLLNSCFVEEVTQELSTG